MSKSYGKKIDNRTKIITALFFGLLLLSSSNAFTSSASGDLIPITNSPTSTTSVPTSTTSVPTSTTSTLVPPITGNPVVPVLPSPTGLTATTVSSSQISLNWNAPGNSGSLVTGYMIERSQDNGITWSTIQSNTGTVSTIYLDAGLSPSTTYTYRVSAVYAGGMTSPPSNTASATTQATTYKLTVSTQLATGDTLLGIYTELRNSSGIVSTGFSPATFVLNNGAQYTIGMGNYATDVFDHWVDTGSTTNPRQVSISSDTQLTAVYRDIALTLAPSRGPIGANVTATGINNAFLSNTSITLSWDGTALATVTSNSTGGFVTTFQVPSAITGSHKVQATDGTNTHSALFTVGPSGPISPQPPTGLTATAISSSQINLSWTAPSDNGGSEITGYKIERSQDNGTTWSLIVTNTSSTSTTYSDTGLSPSIIYNYRVSAINSVGTSTPSNTASATTQSAQSIVPQPPTNLTATAVSSSQINLSWTAPSNNGSSAITGYKIERSQDNGAIWLSIVSNTGSTTTTYSDTGLSPSTTYTYRVSAINSVGSSLPSNTASATTQSVTTLLSPTGLTANAVSSSQISLNWNAPGNSGSLVTGYMIERSQDNGITWSTIQSNTGTVSTIYLDAGLSPSTTYTYRVSAVYAGGMTSPPSNTASATTQATTYKLTVSTQLITGDTLVGLYSELRNSTRQIVATGFSPATFVLNNGAQYTIGMGNYATDVFDHWADTGSTTNPRPVSISSDTQLTAVYRDTALTLAPSRGPVGANVTATGTTFSPSTSITLSWDGTALATVTSNSTGGFVTTFQVPSAITGSHKVQATDGTNTHSALFTVGPSPTISLNTNSANVGTGVRVTGINFTPLSQITISYDGTTIGVGQQNVDSGSTIPSIITTDSNGKFVAIISILRSVTGSHTISAQDTTNDVSSQNIMVSPHVFIYPTSGHAGSQVLIPASQGNGFTANSAITIKFNGTAMLSSAISTDSEGNFGGSFTIPSGSSIGKYQIQVSDASGNMYFTPFNVTSSTSPTYSVQRIVTGMSMPDSFAFIPDKGSGVDGSGAFMVTEKNTGNVIVFNNMNGQFVRQTVPFVTIPNLQTGAEDIGVLGITFDPNWATKMVYFYVTRNVTGTIYGEVIRYHATTDLSGNIIADQSVGEQLVLGNIPAFKTGHNGGHLKFDSQGNLYISTGDGWTFTAGQDLTTMQAKMLRITPLASPSNGQLYSIPSTNPFASSTNTSIKKEIWGYGVRNPFTFDIDSQTGRLYVSDVGYNTWERIDDFTTASANAGWPNYEAPPFGNPQSLTNYTPQVYWFPHQGEEPLTGSTAGLQALTAGVFYHGTNYPSNLQGAYFFGDYGIGFIAALLPSSTASPAIDPASGYPIGKVIPILYGLTEAPINMQVWNGKVYFLELTGNMDVLNYN